MRRGATSRAVAFAAGLAFFGGAGCAQSAPEAELGTGAERFEPLADGEALPFEEGPQGSHHLWIGVRARGFDPDTAELSLELEPLATGRPRQTSIRRLDPRAIGGWHHHVGVPMVLSSPECFRDRAVVVRAHLRDASGRSASDDRVVIPRWPEPLGECDL